MVDGACSYVTLDRVRRTDASLVSLDESLPAPSSEDSGWLDLPVEQILPPRERLVLFLLFEKDMSPEEIGGLLAIEKQTVYALKHKAVNKLRQYVASQKTPAE